MSLEDYSADGLWNVLVETVHELVMYRHHKGYVRDSILPEKPGIKPVELAARLGIPFGEALVILFELASESKG